MRPLAVVAAACLAFVTACGASSHYVARKPEVRVTRKSGCPKAIAKNEDVSNESNANGSLLLPTSKPTSALVCTYAAVYNEGGGLKISRRLTPAQARTLAAIIDRMHLGAAPANEHCPLDENGYVILVFSYRSQPDVDLWWHSDGCGTLDNGRVVSSEGGNPSFYDGFMGEMEALGLRNLAPPFGASTTSTTRG